MSIAIFGRIRIRRNEPSAFPLPAQPIGDCHALWQRQFDGLGDLLADSAEELSFSPLDPPLVHFR